MRKKKRTRSRCSWSSLGKKKLEAIGGKERVISPADKAERSLCYKGGQREKKGPLSLSKGRIPRHLSTTVWSTFREKVVRGEPRSIKRKRK